MNRRAPTRRAVRTNASVACTGCHQGAYQGEGTQPRLAGQSKEYLQQTMMDFRTRARGNNPGMTDLMLAISEDDIAARFFVSVSTVAEVFFAKDVLHAGDVGFAPSPGAHAWTLRNCRALPVQSGDFVGREELAAGDVGRPLEPPGRRLLRGVVGEVGPEAVGLRRVVELAAGPDFDHAAPLA